jgi:hypothetical protein
MAKEERHNTNNKEKGGRDGKKKTELEGKNN